MDRVWQHEKPELSRHLSGRRRELRATTQARPVSPGGPGPGPAGSERAPSEKNASCIRPCRASGALLSLRALGEAKGVVSAESETLTAYGGASGGEPRRAPYASSRAAARGAYGESRADSGDATELARVAAKGSAPAITAAATSAASLASGIVLDRGEKDKCVRVEPSESSCL